MLIRYPLRVCQKSTPFPLMLKNVILIPLPRQLLARHPGEAGAVRMDLFKQGTDSNEDAEQTGTDNLDLVVLLKHFWGLIERSDRVIVLEACAS